MSVKTDLLAAADYINEYGWCRNDFYDAKGKVCLAGAVGVVTGAIKPSKTVKGEWDWTRTKTTRFRYGRALTALALQLDAERVTRRLADFDLNTADQRQATWFKGMTPSQQAEHLAHRALSRPFVTQDIVTTFNDRDEVVAPKKPGGKVTVKRTTKAQAVKLLQRAAAA